MNCLSIITRLLFQVHVAQERLEEILEVPRVVFDEGRPALDEVPEGVPVHVGEGREVVGEAGQGGAGRAQAVADLVGVGGSVEQERLNCI